MAWEADAEALAEALGAAPGTLLSASGRIDGWWFTLAWAAAKLGAGLIGHPGGAVAGPSGAVAPDRDASYPVAGSARRLSGRHPLPDAITFSRRGRPVRRTFTPAAAAAIGPTLADLVARLRAAPGTTLALSGPVADPLLTFLANVVLVGGGRVAHAATPNDALALAAEHGAELVALTADGLDELARLGPDAREALDLTAVEALVTGGAPLSPAACELADDLFGAGAIVDVYLTADTGIAAVRSAGTAHHTLLAGVEARRGPGGALQLRSPLAIDPDWTPTGDRTALHGDRTLAP